MAGSDTYSILVDPRVASRCLAVLIWGEGLQANELLRPPDWFTETLSRSGEGVDPVSVETRDQVRRMLRHGAYKPSGRGKPASEYLASAAGRGEFPVVNGPVDANNAVSLASGLPGSVFDARLSGRSLFVRHGLPGERYVFNRSGQEIDLEDLIVVCREAEGRWQPCGNPVKDCMATKVSAETQDVVGVLYAPLSLGIAVAEFWADRFARLLETGCRARSAGYCAPTEFSAM